MTDPEQRSVHSVLPGMQLGNYRVLRLLGEGGMGAVYEGQHKTLGKTVAIKTLHSHLARQESVRTRFVREGQSAARIVHPNIVDVYDVGEEQEVPYLVMEYLRGRPLSDFLHKKEPLPVERAADFLLPVIAAVAAAHRSGIIHRDLKPDNIFICEETGGERPKVLDFGISKLIDAETAHGLTDTSALLGTPYYMSPEQSRAAKTAGPASDQFSLGVILYELTTGRRPFEGESLLALLQAISSCTFSPPSAVCPSLSLDLEAIILRAMGREPADRYANVSEFGVALLPFCSERIRHVYSQEFQESPPSAFDLTAMGPQSTLPSESGEGTLAASAKSKQVTGRASSKAVLAAVLAAVVGGSAAFYLMRTAPESIPEPAALTQEVPAESLSRRAGTEGALLPVNEERASLAVLEEFEILSTPSSEVIRGQDSIGRTPLKIERPKEGESVELILRAAGYLPKALTLTIDEPELGTEFVLQKAAPSVVPRPRRQPTSSPTAPGLAPR